MSSVSLLSLKLMSILLSFVHRHESSNSSEDELMTGGKSICKQMKYATKWSSCRSEDEVIFEGKTTGSSPIK